MQIKKMLLTVLAITCSTTLATAKTYYIDFTGGKDTANGTTPQTAWQHCPGDTNATDVAADLIPAPGCTLLLKGGVTYHGSIRLEASGTAKQPIVLDGNAAGTFGTGPAILDGGQVINNWQLCKKPADAQDNPRWKEIFYADVALDITPNFTHGQVVSHRQVPTDIMAPWQRVILCDGGHRLLPVAQYPKPKDSFYPDLPEDFLKSSLPIRVDSTAKSSAITDSMYLTQKDPDYYNGMIMGVHGGNNHTYFTAVTGYDPAASQISFAFFKHRIYPQARYAFYNSVRLITEKGEWAVAPLPGGKTRFFLLPDRLENNAPANIGFPVLQTGVQVAAGASHIRIRGFLIQRYSGGKGGIAVAKGSPRSKDITVTDCEVRFVAGHAGIGFNHSDNMTVDNCYVHHCPGWTTGIFLSRVNDYSVHGCYLDKNSGSGVRHYECKQGGLDGNAILNHYGMHSSTINIYEGCEDLVIENNSLHNVIAINRNARNITFRNNVLDSRQKAMQNIALWGSGKTGGTDIDGILIENNTFINIKKADSWETSVFIQKGKTAPPTGIVIRNNVLDFLRTPLDATVENNLFIRKTDAEAAGKNGIAENDPADIFRNPAGGDYRRKEGGPLMTAGANLPPAPAGWKRK